MATTPTISIANQSASEGNDAGKYLVLTLKLSKASQSTVSVQLDTDDQTARDGIDYDAVHQLVSFAPGVTSINVKVPIHSNTTLEPTRVFAVYLSHATGAAIAPNASGAYLPNAWGFIIDDDKLSGYTPPTDWDMQLQWYLYSTRSELAWSHATGKGVKIAVFDQGIDAAHPELKGQVDLGLGRDAATLGAGGAPVLDGDNHGTEVAGVIAAARDGNGLVGVAYGAQLVSIYTQDKYTDTYTTEIANAFRYATAADVMNNSWGFGNLLKHETNWAFLDNANDPAFAPAFQALHDLAATGRGGLGTVVVQSAGNGYGYGDDTNLHNFQNSRYIITVGATDYAGGASWFSTSGASILVAAPGGGGIGDYSSILTTDRGGAAGNTTGNTVLADGTSFSAPIVSGIVALMLEVNPHLGYRDVQQILAYTAHQNQDQDSFYAPSANGAADWNGGGLQYIYGFQTSGFGLVDALAAVRLAATWDGTPKTVANTVDVLASKTLNTAIPDNAPDGVSSDIVIDSSMIVERVDVTVNITHPFIGDLAVILTSPSGTDSYLMMRPSVGGLSAYGSSQSDVHFTFDTVLDMGESAKGTWTLNVADLEPGSVGSFANWTLDLIGHQAEAAHTFIYTDLFPQLVAADAARGVLSDPTGKNDTLNASALGSDDYLDLSGATASVINGGKLAIAAGTTMNNAYGGDGNNIIIANAAGGALHGMAGNDALRGAAGKDVLDGGAGNDTLSGGDGFDIALYHGARANYQITKTADGYTVADGTGADGVDTLTGIERLQFSDSLTSFDDKGVAGQAYRIYQAAFNRTPDAGGLGYWIAQMDKGLGLQEVAGDFVRSDEFKALYGASPSNADVVTHLYGNVLHRAPDAGGAAYWNGMLDSHTLNVAEVLRDFSESAENVATLVGVIQNGITYTPSA